MAMFGISHTKNTRVGDDFVRGVSGGERKRVTIFEAALSYSPLQRWDNSTRGLDSATALEFFRTLRTQADILGTTACVAIYQASQDAYDPTFLTSMTSHQERIVRPDWKGKPPPRSPDEFAEAWKESQHRAALDSEIDDYVDRHPFNNEDYDRFLASRRFDQAKSQCPQSPFTLSYAEQVRLTLWRSWVLLRNDPSMTLTMPVTNLFQALGISSVFYNLPQDSTSISHRAIAEALSAMISDLPYKFVNSVITTLIMYFMANLRREPGPFFFFYLIVIIMTLVMSMMFRLLGSLTKTIAQALAPASVVILIIALYTGFAIKVQYMQNWLGWLRWANPAFYGFESMLLNEFVGRRFRCANFVPAGPGYESVRPDEQVYEIVGSVPGEGFVDGAAYLATSYGYLNSHKWRNVGILIAFAIFFLACHLAAAEYVASDRSKGEVLVFSRKAMGKRRKQGTSDIETTAVRQQEEALESSGGVSNVEEMTSIFHWQNICYNVKIKDETRGILDSVDGWVAPKSLTALMGVLGAGKPTLLDVLASRMTMGVITGDMLVDGKPRDEGGKTVYFGPIGKNLQCLTDYFVRNGGPPCPPDSNPAEHMLHVIGAAPGAHTEIDWPAVWRRSSEYQGVQDELQFAAPFGLQCREVARRVLQQYWRSPTYIYSKAFLSCGAALFIVLSFLNIENTQGGLQNQMFGVFIFLAIFSQLVDQILPVFVSQRTMYEARERPSKSYSWVAFFGANMLVEAVWNSVSMAFIPPLFSHDPRPLPPSMIDRTGTEHSRATTICFFVWACFIFASTFAHFVIAGLDSHDVASAVVGLLTVMMFGFCGIFAGPDALPRFWIFMYRVNPFTYFVEGFPGTALANARASCAPDDFLASVNVDFANRWRNFGIMWAFVVFNVAAAFLLYWLARVPK
ncbi:ZEB2-regulated ABC transporter 1, partial [Colletotrichum shisoi]